jgi:steroid 5-alpha reductase family enzyme
MYFMEGGVMDLKWIVLIMVIEGLSLVGVLSAFLTKDPKVPFIIGFNTLLPVAAIYCWYLDGEVLRKAIILSMVACYQIRMNFTLTAWYNNTAAAKLKSIMPLSQIYLLPVILVNIFGWLYCLPFLWAAGRQGALNWIDYSAISIYTVGTIFHFGSDYQKHIFKKDPGNSGRILDMGFWGLSRHPNYFGDFLIYLAYGVIAGNVWGLIAPLTNLLQYIGDAIPKSEKMAAERYGTSWDKYKNRVRCLIPYII